MRFEPSDRLPERGRGGLRSPLQALNHPAIYLIGLFHQIGEHLLHGRMEQLPAFDI